MDEAMPELRTEVVDDGDDGGGGGAQIQEEEEEERLCRFCLCEEEDAEEDRDDPLVSPCNCTGGQKWVHLKCLHRWQRSVLVTQPTHPAFYERDERQFVCQVCKSPFTIEPPSRAELMAGFTGPELAALLDVGCFIVAERETSVEMAQLYREHQDMPHAVGTLPHWIEGVYLITRVEGDSASDGTLTRLAWRAARALGIGGGDDGQSDCIIAVNLTRRIDPTSLPAPFLTRIKDVPPSVTVHHHIGGPCAQRECVALCPLHATHPDEVAGRLQVLGTQGGTWVGGSPKDVAKAALDDCERRRGEAPSELACTNEDGLEEMAEEYLRQHIVARGIAVPEGGVVTDNDGQSLSEKDTLIVAIRAAGPVPVVHVFWGDARWSRTQLLGELARGGWGMCRATLPDIFPVDPGPTAAEEEGVVVVPYTELWHSIVETDGRLLYAPQSEMTEQRAGTGAALYPGSEESNEEDDNETESANEQMHRHREELRRRVLAQHAAEEERQRIAAAETALEQREQAQAAAHDTSDAARTTAPATEGAASATGHEDTGGNVDSGTQIMIEDHSSAA